MKKLLLSLAICAAMGMSMNASANDHTVTVGYAESKFPTTTTLGNVNLNGVNLKYRYEEDSSVSLITSLTYMWNNLSYSDKTINRQKFDVKQKYKDLSLAAGPAYRFNEFVSIYGLTGVNIFDSKYAKKTHTSNGNTDNESTHFRTTLFMYGAGIQINPMANLALDIGYEGTQKNLRHNSKLKLKGFNLGVGYRF